MIIILQWYSDLVGSSRKFLSQKMRIPNHGPVGPETHLIWHFTRDSSYLNLNTSTLDQTRFFALQKPKDVNEIKIKRWLIQKYHWIYTYEPSLSMNPCWNAWHSINLNHLVLVEPSSSLVWFNQSPLILGWTQTLSNLPLLLESPWGMEISLTHQCVKFLVKSKILIMAPSNLQTGAGVYA